MTDTLDPFDPASLRLDQSYTDGTAVRKVLTTIPVRKPNRQEFVRVHPDPAYTADAVAIIEMKDDREVYLVAPALAADLTGEWATANLFTTINRSGVVFLWPVRGPDSEGKLNQWHESAAKAVDEAKPRWVRITANKSLGGYDVAAAWSNIPDPDWNKALQGLGLNALLKIAFGNRFIQDLDHPLIKQLRGES